MEPCIYALLNVKKHLGVFLFSRCNIKKLMKKSAKGGFFMIITLKDGSKREVQEGISVIDLAKRD